MSTFTTLAVNKRSLRPRKTKVGGVSYIVAPVVMINEGVLNGNNGAIFYSASVLANRVERWNDIPVTLGHPEDSSGNKISARSPKVTDKYTVGRVFNVSVKGKKLKGQAYLDERLMREKAPHTLNQILKGKPVELSTGLFTATSNANGVHGGKPYTSKLVGYEPDHLAILPNEIGACSLADGCGVNTNSLTMNALSHDNIRQLLSKALSKSMATEDRPNPYVYIVDIYPNTVMYRHNDSTFKQGYKKSDKGVVLTGTRQEVEMSRVYKAITRTKTSVSFEPTTVNAGGCGCSCGGKCGPCKDRMKKKKKKDMPFTIAEQIEQGFQKTDNANCGIGSGGFQPGNKCAGGGKSGKGGGGGFSTDFKGPTRIGDEVKATIKTSQGPKSFTMKVMDIDKKPPGGGPPVLYGDSTSGYKAGKEISVDVGQVTARKRGTKPKLPKNLGKYKQSENPKKDQPSDDAVKKMMERRAAKKKKIAGRKTVTPRGTQSDKAVDKFMKWESGLKYANNQ